MTAQGIAADQVVVKALMNGRAIVKACGIECVGIECGIEWGIVQVGRKDKLGKKNWDSVGSDRLGGPDGVL